MENNKIQIKGVGDGLLISVSEEQWKPAQSAIFSKIEETPSFFEGAKIILDVKEIAIKAADLGKLRDKLSTKKINLRTVLSTSEVTLNSAQMLGLPTKMDLGRTTTLKNSKQSSFEGDPAVWIERTLRAGYKIETKCQVVVFGDVNPGAEIISAGSILVWGKLLGSVHAGADGNKSAKVCALELKPTSLQINGIAASPFSGKIKNHPEMANLNDNVIVIQQWNK